MKNPRPVTGSPVISWSILDPPRYRERFAFALAVSLYIHALLLLLRFGAPGFGLPGLAWPWAERRAQGSDLTVRLEYAPRPATPTPASAPVPLAAPPRVPPRTMTAKRPKPVTPSRADSSFEVRLPEAADAVPPRAPLSLPQRETRAPAPAAKARARDRKIRAKPQPQILAQSAPQKETFNVPPPKLAEPEQRAPESAAKKQTEEPPPAVQATEQPPNRQAEEAARLQAEEAARQRAEETARQEAEELARQRALALQKEQEAKRLEDARSIQETRKQEEASNQEEMKKQEEAKRIALEAEALRRAEEAARQQAAARKKELEARRQAEEAAARAREIAEGQRLEAQAAAQRERELLAAQQAPATAPGALSGRELAAKALDQLRTPGAARDDLLRPPSPPASADSPRRRSVFGVERDVVLRMYVDSWRLKIERNGTLNYRLSASSRADNPIVTVSIRSDGSLEDVLINRSSGVRELDEAVRRITRLFAPYSAFPPALARQYDVIEIRRVWSFDNTLRILDEM